VSPTRTAPSVARPPHHTYAHAHTHGMEAQQKSSIESKSNQQRKLVRKNTLNRYLERSLNTQHSEPTLLSRSKAPAVVRRVQICIFDSSNTDCRF
jgi:hypothetical protein